MWHLVFLGGSAFAPTACLCTRAAGFQPAPSCALAAFASLYLELSGLEALLLSSFNECCDVPCMRPLMCLCGSAPLSPLFPAAIIQTSTSCPLLRCCQCAAASSRQVCSAHLLTCLSNRPCFLWSLPHLNSLPYSLFGTVGTMHLSHDSAACQSGAAAMVVGSYATR